jgi:hypothetical protein
MKTQLFTTDEAIINEYSKLYNELEASQECYNKLEALKKHN